MKQEWFASWFDTSYYHLLYHHRDEQEAFHFIEKLVNTLQPEPGARMLDLACGKGRHALQLSQYGFDVTGVDLSESSIAEALMQSTNHLHFFRHDMRKPHAIHYYDWVFNFFTSFGYFEKEKELLQTLNSINISLKKEGHLLIDYLNPVYTLRHLVAEETQYRDEISFDIKRYADGIFFHKQITVNDPAANEPLVFQEKVRQLNLSDFEQLFLKSNFELVNLWGGYALEQFDENSSKRMIMQVRKINP